MSASLGQRPGSGHPSGRTLGSHAIVTLVTMGHDCTYPRYLSWRCHPRDSTSSYVVRVFIVDDQSLFREGLASLLEGPQVRIVGQASSAEEALSRCAEAAPEVVLMDMRMPGVDGAECTRRLLAHFPAVKVLALTTFDDDRTVFAALRAGAIGYLLKDASAELLTAAITAAAAGNATIAPAVLSKVLDEFRRIADTAPISAPCGLSQREREVLQLVASGMSNKEIGRALYLAEGTVKNHLTHIFEKLGVQDRTSAALRAREMGAIRGS